MVVCKVARWPIEVVWAFNSRDTRLRLVWTRIPIRIGPRSPSEKLVGLAKDVFLTSNLRQNCGFVRRHRRFPIGSSVGKKILAYLRVQARNSRCIADQISDRLREFGCPLLIDVVKTISPITAANTEICLFRTRSTVMA